MTPTSANWIDYLTLGAALLAAGGPAVQIWITRRKERERFDVSLQWGVAPDHSGAPDEYPFLHVHNRSEHKIFIDEVFCARGPFRRRRCHGTALDYEDPFFDLAFPYEVKPNDILRLRLQERIAEHELARVGKVKTVAGWIRRPSVWFGIRTIAGTKRMIGAEAAIAWGKRPQWTKYED